MNSAHKISDAAETMFKIIVVVVSLERREDATYVTSGHRLGLENYNTDRIVLLYGVMEVSSSLVAYRCAELF